MSIRSYHRRRYGVGNTSDTIYIHFGEDDHGFCWVAAACSDPADLPLDAELHGPFATETEAHADAERTLFGNAAIRDGGMWDPNWEKLQ